MAPERNHVAGIEAKHSRDSIGPAKVSGERTPPKREMNRPAIVGNMNMLAFDLKGKNGVHKYRATHTKTLPTPPVETNCGKSVRRTQTVTWVNSAVVTMRSAIAA
jgi:hypothetical protein